MVEIGFSGSSTLVLKGSTAHHWQLSREAELKGGAPAAEGNQAPLQEASVQANATYKEFIDRYQEGDLVYGLGAERANYIKAKYPDYE